MTERMLQVVSLVSWRIHRDERGLNTAEMLGNAALAILALVVIWAALQRLGVDIVGWIGDQVRGGGGQVG